MPRGKQLAGRLWGLSKTSEAAWTDTLAGLTPQYSRFPAVHQNKTPLEDDHSSALTHATGSPPL